MTCVVGEDGFHLADSMGLADEGAGPSLLMYRHDWLCWPSSFLLGRW